MSASLEVCVTTEQSCDARVFDPQACSQVLCVTMPATSAKVVLIWFSPSSRALLLPKDIGPPLPPAPPCICRIKNANTAIIIRMGKCIGMMSKNRFRILSGIVILIMIYLYSIEPTSYKTRVKIDKTWESLVQNCGYAAYEENSFRANHFYSQFT